MKEYNTTEINNLVISGKVKVISSTPTVVEIYWKKNNKREVVIYGANK